MARARVAALTHKVAQLRAAADRPGLTGIAGERAYQRINLAVNDLNRWRAQLGMVPISQYA